MKNISDYIPVFNFIKHFLQILNDVQQTARATAVDVEKNVSEFLNRASQVFDDAIKQPE